MRNMHNAVIVRAARADVVKLPAGIYITTIREMMSRKYASIRFGVQLFLWTDSIIFCEYINLVGSTSAVVDF